MTPMTMYTALVAGQQNNAHYPHQHDVTSEADLEAVARLDHVVAEYVGGRRSAGSFVTSNCLVMDVDNSHTDNPAEWITPASLAEQMPGVAFMTATSRNHMKSKGAQSARPRFHVYFPIGPVADAEAYAGLKKLLASRFEFFDPNAIDAGRFIYGHAAPLITMVEGECAIDHWLAEAVDEDLFAQWDDSTQAIEEGSRNATLSRFAGRLLIRLGTTDEARALFDRKAARCNPPLPESEVESIWRSATRFAKTVENQPGYLPPEDFEASLDSVRPSDYSDVGQAHALTKAYPDSLRYSEATDWLVYYDGVWYESAPAAQAVAQELTERQLAEAHELLEDAKDKLATTGAGTLLGSMSKAKAQTMFNPAQREAFAAFEDAKTYATYALKRRESRGITNCLREARPMLLTTPEQLDADPYLLNTPSGSYDLRIGPASKRDHDPADLVTKQTSLDPDTTGAEVWQEALEVFFQGDQELIDYVQRIVGLAAIGQVFVEALVIAYGDGRNGKSTFWNTIARVLGTYAGNMSADVLTIGGMRNVKPELAEAKGKRLIISAESEEGVRMSTSVVKQLASTDQIYAEKKYKAPFAFTPSHTLILYTNHLPRVGAMDAGIWRRLIVIPFEAKIEGQSDVKNYADHLYHEAGGAILTWIMEGARLIHAENYHLKAPARVVAASSAYREENNWFAQFLDTHCDVDEHLSERAGDLYQTYRAWAMSTSGWARPMVDFNATVEHHGFVRKKMKSGIRVFGLQLKNEFDQQ
ncbi:phage/plasmid primase, P4 family [Trueperella pecoris]|uniref:phage/plasmid primase, P4 family n=1 Tax=Trueperella pecoris TaxID=2733571 RepID=UPI00186B93AB|nr:phage/plasmid primase, P4 family [Trueperella pecoris]QOQ39381.1 DNA primase [Trueperella pecoris]